MAGRVIGADRVRAHRRAGVHGGVVFNCGSNLFVDAAADLTLGAGFRGNQSRTDRFGAYRLLDAV